MKTALSLLTILISSSISMAGMAATVQPNSDTNVASNTGYELQAPATIIRSEVNFKIDDDKNVTETRTITARLDTQNGVSGFSQIPLGYNPEFDTVTILEAYTTKSNGTRIDVDKSKILETQSQGSVDNVMFNNNKVKNIIFPSTSIGDTITLSYKVKRKPLFQGQISISEAQRDGIPVENASVTIDAPSNLDIKVDSATYQGGTKQNVSGRSIWQWTLKNYTPNVPEAQTAILVQNVPAIFATTFADYKQAGNTYFNNNQSKAVVTNDIKTLANDITKDIAKDDKSAQAKALYNWVSSNIRYVAVYFGDGNVVPHDANEVLNNRYGDCKDHVVLLDALLQAKGIQSVPVLINLTNTYNTPKVASMPGVFNHVITYIPELDVFVDSTIGVAKFGDLAMSEMGKPALMTNSGKIVTIPLTPSSTSTDIANIELQPSGMATGTTKATQTGAFDILSRLYATGIPQGMTAQAAKSFLQSSNQVGTGNIQLTDPYNLSSNFSTETSYTLNRVFDHNHSSRFILPLGITGFSSMSSTMFDNLTAIPSRKEPFVVPNGKFKSTWSYKLPQNMKVTKLPKNASFANEMGSYQSTYSLNGHTLDVSRELSILWNGSYAKPNAFSKFLNLNDAMSNDFNQQVSYDIQ